MSNLFLDGMFSNNCNSPSRVTITMPGGALNLTGLMTGDPSFSAGTKWGTILNDLSNLAEFSSLIGSSNIWSWIGASTMCWKGTNPLGVSIEFYLIHYSPKQDLKTPLKQLVKLASLERSDANVSDLQVKVHGGYAPDIFASNNDFFSNLKISDIDALKGSSNLDKVGKGMVNDSAKGTLQVQFGNKLVIKNLLLAKIDVTASNIEVANLDGTNQKPLFYRVQAQFTGARPFVSTDVDSMFL